MAHEVFGHGSRARELGASPRYTFRLPEPYASILSPSDPNALVGGDYSGVTLPPAQDAVVRLGGPESGYLMAWWIDAEAVAARGWIRHDDLLVYGVAKIVYSNDLFSSSLERTGSVDTDLAAYVTNLQDRFGRPRSADRLAMVHRLRAAYLWNLADPTLLFAAYGTVVDSLWNGSRYSRLPLPSNRRHHRLRDPALRAQPLRGRALRRRLRVPRIHSRRRLRPRRQQQPRHVRRGRGAGTRLDASARAVARRRRRRMEPAPRAPGGPGPGVGLLGAPRPAATGDSPGASVGVYGRLNVLGKLGVTGKVAYKTSGYLMGAPVGDGVYGYVGVSVEP